MRQRRVRALAQIARFNRPDYRADAVDLQVEEGGAGRDNDAIGGRQSCPREASPAPARCAPADVSPPDKPPGDARGRGPRRPAGHADDACARGRPRLPTVGRCRRVDGSSRGPAGGADGRWRCSEGRLGDGAARE